ncbi:MAG: PAS domain S-box protein [Syntrophomonadaceae bacterium]|nr:PAS domain S-box protein [Syntrophomonadaceae bacterium]
MRRPETSWQDASFYAEIGKTKDQLIAEIKKLRRQIAEAAEKTAEAAQLLQDETTKRKQVEQQMEKLKALVTNGLNGISDAFFFLNNRWQVIYMNQEAEKFLARHKSEVIGKSIWKFFPVAISSLLHKKYIKFLNHKKAISFEHFSETDSKWYEVCAYPSAGNLSIYIRDITKRKKTEEALRLSEERFSKAFSSSPDIMVISTWEKGRLVEVNDHFLHVFGYERREIIGRTTTELNIWAELREREKAVELLQKQGSFHNMEINLVTNSGELRTGLFSAELLEIGGKKHILWAGKDITQRKHVEQALQESEQRISDIINFLPDATVVIDKYGKVIAWNKAAEDMTGIKSENILGKGNYEYAIPFYGTRRPILVDLVLNYDEEWAANYPDIEKKGETLIGENFCPIVGESGAYLRAAAAPLYDTKGNIVGAIESIRDVTDRHQAEKALEASEEMYRRIVETANEGILTINNDNVITFVNTKMAEMLGYSIDEMIEKPLFDFIHEENHSTVVQHLKRCQQGNSEKYDLEFRCKNGSSLWAIVSANVILDTDGKYLGSLKMITDITERKKMEKQMAHLDRLNLVGEIAAGIGHEIRNPMTSVRGFLQIMREQKKYFEDKEFFDLMIEELDRANSIITEFLSLAKNKAVELKPHNLNQIIQALSPLIQAEAMVQDKYVKIELAEVPILLLDEREIRQLILNLVRNGLEAMPPSGSLAIETFAIGQEVVLAVQDQGEGIDPELVDKLGTPFLTTKNNGTGLGLAVCYSIANRHDATIDVETSAEGTTFFIRFKKQPQFVI